MGHPRQYVLFTCLHRRIEEEAAYGIRRKCPRPAVRWFPLVLRDRPTVITPTHTHTHTHTVNVAGSFLLGALSVSTNLDPRLKLMAGTGFCGALTTFSTFSVDTVRGPPARRLPCRAVIDGKKRGRPGWSPRRLSCPSHICIDGMILPVVSYTHPPAKTGPAPARRSDGQGRRLRPRQQRRGVRSLLLVSKLCMYVQCLLPDRPISEIDRPSQSSTTNRIAHLVKKSTNQPINATQPPPQNPRRRPRHPPLPWQPPAAGAARGAGGVPKDAGQPRGIPRGVSGPAARGRLAAAASCRVGPRGGERAAVVAAAAAAAAVGHPAFVLVLVGVVVWKDGAMKWNWIGMH